MRMITPHRFDEHVALVETIAVAGITPPP